MRHHTVRPGRAFRFAMTAITLLIAQTALAGWEELPPLPKGNMNREQVYHEGKLYVFGGYDMSANGFISGGVVLGLDQAGIAEGWKPLEGFNESRSGGFAASIGGKIYIAGGYSGVTGGVFDFTRPVTELDPATGASKEKAPIPLDLVNPLGAFVDGRIVLMGGQVKSGTSYTRSFATLIYDAAQDRWSQGSDLPYSAEGMSVTAVGSAIYLIGGMNGSTHTGMPRAYTGTIQGESITWTPIADFPIPIAYAASGIAAGELVVTGGRGVLSSGMEISRRTYRYDPAGKTWTIDSPLPRNATASESMPGDGTSIYYIGAGDNGAGVLRYTIGEDLPVADIISEIDHLITLASGGERIVETALVNNGTAPLSCSLRVPAEAAGWVEVNPPSAMISPGDTALFEARVLAGSIPSGAYTTALAVETNDPELKGAAVRIRLHVVASIATQPTRLVIESATSYLQKYSARGHRMLDTLLATYGADRLSIVNYHVEYPNDSLLLPAGDTLMSILAGSDGIFYPGGAVQRFPFGSAMIPDAFWPYAIDSLLARGIESPVLLSLSGDGLQYDAERKRVAASAVITLSTARPTGGGREYRLTAVVTEDSIPTAQKDMLPNGNTTTRKPYYEPGTARAIWPEARGRALTFPAPSIEAGETILPGATTTETIEVDASRLIDPMRARLIIFVSEWDGNTPGEILQAIEQPLIPRTSDAPIAMEVDEHLIEIIPNPAAQQARLRLPERLRGKVTIDLHPVDGSASVLRLSREIEGKGSIDLDLSGLPGGSYLLTVRSSSDLFTRPLTIVR